MCLFDMQVKRRQEAEKAHFNKMMAEFLAKSTIDDGVVTLLLKLNKLTKLEDMLNVAMSIEGYFKANNKELIDQRLAAIINAIKFAASHRKSAFDAIRRAEQAYNAENSKEDKHSENLSCEISDSVEIKSDIELVNAALFLHQLSEIVRIFSSTEDKNARLASFSLEELVQLEVSGCFNFLTGFLCTDDHENFVPEVTTLLKTLVNYGGVVFGSATEFLAVKQLSYDNEYLRSNYVFKKKTLFGVGLRDIVASINENRPSENPYSSLVELALKKGKVKQFHFMTEIRHFS